MSDKPKYEKLNSGKPMHEELNNDKPKYEKLNSGKPILEQLNSDKPTYLNPAMATQLTMRDLWDRFQFISR